MPDSGTRPRPRVLVVDDHEDTREMYVWCLRAAGWIVDAVGDGEAATIVASEFVPDVILMDLRLPVLGGIEATRRLKDDPRTRHVPIVACTGDRSMSALEARAAGCDELVTKPIEPEALRELLEKTLAGRSYEPE
jgi:two-component system cell cycle response regulator DivK